MQYHWKMYNDILLYWFFGTPLIFNIHFILLYICESTSKLLYKVIPLWGRNSPIIISSLYPAEVLTGCHSGGMDGLFRQQSARVGLNVDVGLSPTHTDRISLTWLSWQCQTSHRWRECVCEWAREQDTVKEYSEQQVRRKVCKNVSVCLNHI